MKRILIVGSTSVVGRAIGLHLDTIHHVNYAGRSNADYKIDVESDSLAAITGTRFDTVINVTAGFRDTNQNDFIRSAYINTIGTLRVCRIATEVAAKHLVQISSAFADIPADNALNNVYALSKRHGDELAKLYCTKFSIPLAIIRPTQIYDAAGNCQNHQSAFYHIVDKASEGNDIRIEGSHDPLRNYIFLDDLAKIVERVVQSNTTGILRCSGPTNISLGGLARTAFSVFNKGGKVVFDASFPSIEDLIVDGYDTENLWKRIGFAATTTVEEGIEAIKRHRDSEQ